MRLVRKEKKMLPTQTPTDPPIKIGVQMIEVKPDDAEQRLDRWLRRVFPQLTQGQIEKMCRKGQLRADGERVKSATRLIEGQMIRVPPSQQKMPPLIMTRMRHAPAL